MKKWRRLLALGISVCMISTSLSVTAYEQEEESGQLTEREAEQNLEADSDALGEQKAEIATQNDSKEIVASGKCGVSAEWTYYRDKTLVISGTGPMDSYKFDQKESISTAPWMNYRSRIKKIVVEDGITSIGSYAFKECGFGFDENTCDALKEIVIGNDVEVIEKEAFYGCNPFTVAPIDSVTIGSGVQKIAMDAFRTTGSILNVKIPDLKKWMQIDFENDASNPMWGGMFPRDNAAINLYINGVRITDLVIPEEIAEIKDYTFWNWRLRSVKWPQENKVINIGKGAFAYNEFSQMMIPESINFIGDSAFESCVNLQKIEIPDSVQNMGAGAFMRCSSMKTARLSQKLTEISGMAFAQCSQLQSIEMPILTEKIGDSAFSKCSSLGAIIIPQNVTSIGESAFSECSSITNFYIPDKVTTIGYGAFRKCDLITKVELPDSVVNIGADIFCDDKKLESIGLSSNLKTISEGMAMGCASLKNIEIPESVETIEKNAFSNCSSLTSITGAENVSVIGESAFSGCSQLISVTVPEKVMIISNGTFTGCTNLMEVNLSSGISEVGKNAFLNCEKLQSVMLPETVQSLGSGAFEGCTSLATIQITDSVEVIPATCFKKCIALTKIVIPAKVTSIETSAFDGCKNLKEITFTGDAPKIATDAFREVKATCYYPKENITYTAEITTQDFGGDLQWTYEGEEENPDANKCGDHITWTLSEDGVLTLTGNGNMYDYSKNDLKYAPWYEDRKRVVSVQISDGITSIGNYAFYECALTAVDNLPNSITRIGENAFNKCTNLKSVKNLPDSIMEIGSYAFSECKLTTIKLPNNLENISEGMLSENRYLKQIEFPAKIRTIGDSAFYMCIGLMSIEIPEGVVSIGERAFSQCGNYATWGLYYSCSDFTSVKLPSTLKNLGEAAFNYCSSLQRINIPDSLTEIKPETFTYCYKLCNVTFEWGYPIMPDNIFCTLYQHTTQLNCYYPSNNPVWTADKLKNYGAKSIKWIGQEMQEPAPGSGGNSGSGGEGNEGTGSGSGGGSGSESGGSSGSGSTSGGGSSSGSGSTSGGGSSSGSGNTSGSGSTSGGGNRPGSGEAMELGFSAHSLTLNGKIGINFYLELNDVLANDQTAVMEMEIKGKKIGNIKVTDAVQKGTTPVKDKNGNDHQCYKFTCYVAAKQMTDKITATLRTASGTWKEVYSVQAYADSALKGDNENLKAMVNAMLVYGGHAQNLFEYNINDLAGGSLKDVSSVTGEQLTQYAYTKSGTEEKLQLYGSSLILNENTTIRMYYQLKEGEITSYKFTIDGQEVVPQKSEDDGLYYVDLNNIAAQDLEVTHIFTAGNIKVTNFSALSYVNIALKYKGTKEANRNVAAALYLYWEAAERYFNNN